MWIPYSLLYPQKITCGSGEYVWMPYSYYFIHKKLPVGLENICGCHTLITLSTPPVAIILALEQYSKQFTPLGMETSIIMIKTLFLNKNVQIIPQILNYNKFLQKHMNILQGLLFLFYTCNTQILN
jgi:hypothetical protein